jgi:polyhydroxybutyrate depolymerase
MPHLRLGSSPSAHLARTLLAVLLAGSLALGAAACSDDGADDADAGETTEASGPNDDEPGGGDAAADEPTTAVGPGEVASAPPVPSAGCGTTNVRSTSLEREYLDDSDRWWLLTTPLDHDGSTPLPMVIDFHGLSEGASIHSRMSDFGTFAEETGVIAVLPNGTGTPVRWDVGLDIDSNPDLEFVDAMVDQLEAKLCVDTSRIYATGLSNGAFMSSTVACSLADRFAAVAPVAGVLRSEDCAPARPVPMLGFHGTADDILIFNGGVGGRLNEILAGNTDAEAEELPEVDLDGEGYPANVRAWAEDNGCEPEPTDTELSDTALLRTYDCPVDAAVEFIVLEGGGHSWPGSEFSASLEGVVGPTDPLSANETMWAFFQRFALPAS